MLFEKGYLFVKAEEIELNDLLFAIATQTGIAYSSFIPLEQSISVDIEWRPVAEAIAYILRDHSFVYVSTTSPRLWILPQDGGEATATDSIYMGFQLEPIDMDTSLQLQAMSDDPELREDALIDLGKSVQQDPVELFSSAISDPDFRVREAAVASLLEIGGNEAVETLTIALGDSNPRIREAAIDALGEIGGDMAISGLKQALVDDVSYVQQAAMEALDLLGE
ncbi:MAG: HEAT repeat domain-containing protein [Candidatus Thiodiazotropha sp.]